jgi:hypothetical protein
MELKQEQKAVIELLQYLHSTFGNCQVVFNLINNNVQLSAVMPQYAQEQKGVELDLKTSEEKIDLSYIN